MARATAGRRTKIVRLMLNEQEYDAVAAEADYNGVPLAVWFRQLGLQAARDGQRQRRDD